MDSFAEGVVAFDRQGGRAHAVCVKHLWCDQYSDRYSLRQALFRWAEASAEFGGNVARNLFMPAGAVDVPISVADF